MYISRLMICFTNHRVPTKGSSITFVQSDIDPLATYLAESEETSLHFFRSVGTALSSISLML